MIPRLSALVVVLLVTGSSCTASPAVRGLPRLFSSAARAAIGSNIDRVAQKAGLTSSKLEQLLARDADLGFAPGSDSLVYACSGLLHQHASGPAGPLLAAASTVEATSGDPTAGDLSNVGDLLQAAASSDGVNGSTDGASGARRRLLTAADGVSSDASPAGADPVDLSLAFKLHSRPGAPKRILLDFDGHTPAGSAWTVKRATPLVVPAFSYDTDRTTFNDQERHDIIMMWRAVAEDYAAWDVDVTTEDDGRDLTNFGVRVLIGGSSMSVFGDGNYGGIALVGNFGVPFYDPAFVFPESLGNNPKAIAESISHETGHRLGLHHDGVTSGPAYYGGEGNWAPIMGAAYGKPITTFSKGEYPGANNQEDDIAIISATLPLRPDDHGDSPAAASPLMPGAQQLPTNLGRMSASAVGNIEIAGSQDWFSFDSDPGKLVIALDLTPNGSFTGYPNYVRSNLDASIAVFQASTGAQVAAFDPLGMLLSGSNTLQLPAAGTYNVRVMGVGDGSPASGGYSSYASLGQYKLSLEFPTLGNGNDGQVPESPQQPPAVTSPSPGPQLIVKVVSYTLRPTAARARVTNAKIVVTDENGNPQPGATVSFTWSHVPSTGAPAFAPLSRNLVTKSVKAAATRGSFLTTSPYAPKGAIRLTVTGVYPGGASKSAAAWNRDKSDAVRDFTW